jgi:hypothetical protein
MIVTLGPVPSSNEIVRLDAAGEPVRRTLAEMTADKVVSAINWHNNEANRLDRESGPSADIATAVAPGGDPSLRLRGKRCSER